MTILALIQNAIDVPMMDTKNIAPIIESYCKYTFFEETAISSFTIEIQSENEGLEKRFIVCDEGHYVVEDPTHDIEFVKGEPICNAKRGTYHMNRFKENPSKYLFISNGWGTVMWRITKKFATEEAFNQYGSREIAKWVRIYNAPLLLNGRWINIKYDDTYIFRGLDEEDEDVQFTPEIAKQVFDVFFD